MVRLRNLRIGVVGLGYVGLPLAVEFGKHFRTTGFDLKADRIKELQAGRDSTLETTRQELKDAAPVVHARPEGPQSLPRLHRHRPHADRRLQAAGSHPPRQGQRELGRGPQEGRHRHL
jgi:UDP-glucose/GDP-mannose dehydrogenase family, NAD binding domain